MKPEHAHWCRNLMLMLAEDGEWGVPRSGLIFKKRANKLILVEIAPYFNESYQLADYEVIKQNFEEAGITVESEVKFS